MAVVIRAYLSVIDEVGNFAHRRFTVHRFQRKAAMFSGFEFDDNLMRVNRGNGSSQSFSGNCDVISVL